MDSTGDKKRTTHQIKPYARTEYPGQKVQVDVKYVTSYCVLNGRKYYQYTLWMNVLDGHTENCMMNIAHTVRQVFLLIWSKTVLSQSEKYKPIMEQNLQTHCR